MRLSCAKQTGFTLTEMIVVTVVMGILIGMAAPSFQGMMVGGTLTSGANDMVSSFMLARSEAVKRGGRVTICKTTTADTLNPVCNNSATWEKGWLIFDDLDENGSRDSAEDVIQVHGAFKYGFVVTADALFADYVSFNELGASTQLNNAFASGSFVLSFGSETRTVLLQSNGRAKVN